MRLLITLLLDRRARVEEGIRCGDGRTVTIDILWRREEEVWRRASLGEDAWDVGIGDLLAEVPDYLQVVCATLRALSPEPKAKRVVTVEVNGVTVTAKQEGRLVDVGVPEEMEVLGCRSD